MLPYAVCCYDPPPLTQKVLICFPSAACLADVYVFTVSFSCLRVCFLWEGVCDSGPAKSDVWDAKGGVVPYFSASPAPAVWSSRPRLFLPPLSSRLLPLSFCGGVCFLPSFPPSFPPSWLHFFIGCHQFNQKVFAFVPCFI